MRPSCRCDGADHEPRFVAITGGPGAGKTAVLEVVQRHFCEHVVVLPESASILFRGGFPRIDSAAGHRAVQRAVYRVQLELERLALDQHHAALVLCDRGTVDGVAYWPAAQPTFWADLGTSLDAELARYSAVVHLRTPPAHGGYDHSNPLRIETPAEARAIDARILQAWSGHPRRTVIDSSPGFLEKLEVAMAAIRALVPTCCAIP